LDDKIIMTEISTLDNNITIVTNPNYNVETTAIGIWLKNGVRSENTNEHGYAHFLEHLVFKQTKYHTGQQLSSRFEIMGGHINAETGRELTAFHGLVPKHYTIDLLKLFIEMLFHSDFTKNDFNIERDVVLQELAMLNDDPEEALEDFATEQVWSNHPMGRQILGSRESLHHAQHNNLVKYLTNVTGNNRLSIVVTGNVNHDEVCQVVNMLTQTTQTAVPETLAPEFITTCKHLDIPAEQHHLLWVMPAVAYNDDKQPAYELANHILAGGYDSRLYQVLREQLGLVYSIDSRVDHYSDTGLWFIQTNTEKENSDKTTSAVEKTIVDFIKNGPTESEMEFARQHLQSSLIVAQDDLEARMDKMARDIFYTGNIINTEDLLEKLSTVSIDDVQNLLKQGWAKVSHFTAG